ncbi:UNVERIFIED_CONTAM: Sodium channel modifier 1 [Sesamum calycinum]|uniref:Sodium channel modifier 1 n=1 Tax=Sesamum calycinum TaxID=2727403 RepID=A0AAW2PKS7_9LAMI
MFGIGMANWNYTAAANWNHTAAAPNCNNYTAPAKYWNRTAAANWFWGTGTSSLPADSSSVDQKTGADASSPESSPARKFSVAELQTYVEMSVFGGDSWAREAHYRKRRVDDLIIEGVEASAYKKLPNGKFACIICPNNPVLDTPIMLSAHVNGSRHRAAELSVKIENWLCKKRLISDWHYSDCVNTKAKANASVKQRKSTSTPLIDRARKAASEVFPGGVDQPEMKSAIGTCQRDAANRLPRASREELKFTAAGWKRDCHGRWFKDENVEFDSDEEDPNIVLNNTS